MGKSGMASTNRKPSTTSAARRPNPSGVASFGRVAKNRESCQVTKKGKVPDITEHLGTDAQFKAIGEKIDASMENRYGGSRRKGPTGATAGSNYSRRDWNRSDKGQAGKAMRGPRGKGGEAWDVRLENLPENKSTKRGSN